MTLFNKSYKLYNIIIIMHSGYYYVRSLVHCADMEIGIPIRYTPVGFYGPDDSVNPLINVSMMSLMVILYIVSMFSVNRSPNVVFTASKNGTSIF